MSAEALRNLSLPSGEGGRAKGKGLRPPCFTDQRRATVASEDSAEILNAAHSCTGRSIPFDHSHKWDNPEGDEEEEDERPLHAPGVGLESRELGAIVCQSCLIPVRAF